MAKLSAIRTSLATTQRSGAPVTSASWLVWAVTASIITPIVLLTRAVEPRPTWWSVLALGIGAVMAASSGHHAGRWLEAHGAGRPNDGGDVDPRTVHEATGLAAIATGLVWDRTWNQVAPSWAQTASIVVVWSVAAVWLVVVYVRGRGTATERRGSRDAAR